MHAFVKSNIQLSMVSAVRKWCNQTYPGGQAALVENCFDQSQAHAQQQSTISKWLAAPRLEGPSPKLHHPPE